MSKHHDKQYPGEDPKYRSARDELLAAEVDLRSQFERVAELRSKLPPGGLIKEDYVFEGVETAVGPKGPVKLSELFTRGKRSLFVQSFMFGPDWDSPCPSCTSIADTFNGYAHHIRERMDFVIVAKAPAEKLGQWARKRGWNNIRLLSSQNNEFNVDYFVQSPGKPAEQMPASHVFVKRDDGIHHFWSTELFWVSRGGHPRHVDMLWPMWHVMDMTPEGRGDWLPSLSYE